MRVCPDWRCAELNAPDAISCHQCGKNLLHPEGRRQNGGKASHPDLADTLLRRASESDVDQWAEAR